MKKNTEEYTEIRIDSRKPLELMIKDMSKYNGYESTKILGIYILEQLKLKRPELNLGLYTKNGTTDHSHPLSAYSGQFQYYISLREKPLQSFEEFDKVKIIGHGNINYTVIVNDFKLEECVQTIVHQLKTYSEVDRFIELKYTIN